MILIVVRRSARLWALVVVALIAIVAGAALAGRPYGVPVSGKVLPIYRVITPNKAVALTFDIGWGEVCPGLVLDVLKQKGLSCTFFLSGPWAASHPDIVRRIAADGHEVGSHGWWHDNLSQCSRERIVESLRKTRETITNLAGREAKLFRPPNGDYDDEVVLTAMEEGYHTIIWSLDSLDWKNPGVDYMIDRLLTRAQAGDIILCHASDSARETYLALPPVIDGLRANGFRLLRLSELLALAGNRYIIQPPRDLIR
ncbi:MAG: polysaccharide deacetylase family protein [Ignavibacteriales bacterium]